MFDELAERSLMSPLAGTKHTYVRLAIIIYCQILALFFQSESSSIMNARRLQELGCCFAISGARFERPMMKDT